MLGYADTSVVLRYLFKEPNAFEDWESLDGVLSCSLLNIECLRAIDQLRLQQKLTDEEVALKVVGLKDIHSLMTQIPLENKILNRAAEPFPTIVSTLDAIHLAAALYLRENVESNIIFLTHDIQQRRAAQALQFEVPEI